MNLQTTQAELDAVASYARQNNFLIPEIWEVGPGVLVILQINSSNQEPYGAGILFDLNRWRIKPAVLEEMPNLVEFASKAEAGNYALIDTDQGHSHVVFGMTKLDKAAEEARKMLEPTAGDTLYEYSIKLNCGELGAT